MEAAVQESLDEGVLSRMLVALLGAESGSFLANAAAVGGSSGRAGGHGSLMETLERAGLTPLQALSIMQGASQVRVYTLGCYGPLQLPQCLCLLRSCLVRSFYCCCPQACGPWGQWESGFCVVPVAWCRCFTRMRQAVLLLHVPPWRWWGADLGWSTLPWLPLAGVARTDLGSSKELFRALRDAGIGGLDAARTVKDIHEGSERARATAVAVAQRAQATALATARSAIQKATDAEWVRCLPLL
jgi:hypothetical protein